MIRTLLTLTAVMFILFICSAAIAADSEEALPAPQPAASTDGPSVRPAAAPRSVIVYPPYSYQVNPYHRSPVQVYRNGQYGRHFGDYYRDRNGGFFYGYDSRYRFGIHR